MTRDAVRLADLSRCFQGVIPSVVATSDAAGIPNVTYASQVYLVDEKHVALSCQFFNKTRRNLDANPVACVEVYDPLTMQPWRLRVRYLRSETSGRLFASMALRIEAIASHTGMSGIFRLIAADVFEVMRIERVGGFLTDAVADPGPLSIDGFRTELRGLQFISERISQAADLQSLLDGVLDALETYFGYRHTMVLLLDEGAGKLVTIASRGYGESGVGAEVPLGEGLIGTVAAERRALTITGLDEGLRYGRAVRREAADSGHAVAPEIPLPGLGDAKSALIIPLAVGNCLIGVLAAESRDPVAFAEWHEAYLEVIGNQIAFGIDRMAERSAEEAADVAAPVVKAEVARHVPPAQKRTLVYYRNDDSLFADGEYLIRSVPARILWKLLGEWQSAGRREFTNRELRLDGSLGMPVGRDNLESRLILLRTRLREKCPDIRLVPTARGRFALEVDARVEMVEK